MSSISSSKDQNVKGGEKFYSELRFLILERESVPLLSKIPGDPTVGFLWAKKQSGSTLRGLRVGTGFREFQQTS